MRSAAPLGALRPALAAALLGLAAWNVRAALEPTPALGAGTFATQAAVAAALLAVRIAGGRAGRSRLSLDFRAPRAFGSAWALYLLSLVPVAALTAWTSRETLALGFYAEDWAVLHLARRIVESSGPRDLLRMLFVGSESSAYIAQFRPVFWLAWAANYALWGEWAEGYRWTNIGLHALFAASAGAFVLATLGSLGAAVLAALLLAVHPARMETLTELTQRHIAIEAACLLGALAVLLVRDRRGRGGGSPLLLSLLLVAALARETWLAFLPLAAAALTAARGRLDPPRLARALAPAAILAAAYLAVLVFGYYGSARMLHGGARALNRTWPPAEALRIAYGRQLAGELLPGADAALFAFSPDPCKGETAGRLRGARLLFATLLLAALPLKRRGDPKLLLVGLLWIGAFVVPAPFYILPITQSRYYAASAFAAIWLAVWIWEEPLPRSARAALGAGAAGLLALISLRELPATHAAAGAPLTARQIEPFRDAVHRLSDGAEIYLLAPEKEGAAWRAALNWLLARHWHAPNREKTLRPFVLGPDLLARGGAHAVPTPFALDQAAALPSAFRALFEWDPRAARFADRSADLDRALARLRERPAPQAPAPPIRVALQDCEALLHEAAPVAGCREATWEFADPFDPAGVGEVRVPLPPEAGAALLWNGRAEAFPGEEAVLAERGAEETVFRVRDSLPWLLSPPLARLTARWIGEGEPGALRLAPRGKP